METLRRRGGFWPTLSVCLLACASTPHGQTNTGEIAGVVRDSQGLVIPGVTIVAQHNDTGARTQRETDGEGRYLLPALRPGSYTVTADLIGFVRVTRPALELMLGQRLQLDIILQIGVRTEQITITEDPPLLQDASAEISDVIGNLQVVQIPLNSRNFLALVQLSDGVVLPPGGTRGDALQQAGALPNVGGQRSGHNIYMIDGVKVTDELFNNLVINPSVDSIDEFKIQKSQYAAEFGGKASALINVSTKAGANTVRGSAFSFGRHDRFDSRGPFDPRDRNKPLLRQHQFGATVGGPLRRDKRFFFVSYEGLHSRRGLTRTFSVPGEAARRGELGPLRLDPASIDPVASALLMKVPLPNRPGEVQNLVAVENQVKDSHQFSLRADVQLTGDDQLMGRFSSFDADEKQPFGTSALQETLVPGFGRRVNTAARNVAASHTHVFGSSLLNEIRFGWLHARGGQRNANQGIDFAHATGLQGVTSDPRDVGYPQISTRGLYSTFGDPATTIARDNRHVELYENLLLDRGRHRVKVGGYWFHLGFRPEQPDNARGAFTFTGQFTGNALADFLLGYPASAMSGVGRGSEDGRTNWWHVFAQDDWRVSDTLSLNLGIRYEYNEHMRDVQNRLSTVDLETPGGRFVIASDQDGRLNPDAEALLPLIPVPYTSSAAAGWTRGLLAPSRIRLAPRTGFAWSLDEAHSAVIRGGYGIFLNQWAYSVQTAFARNLPFFYAKQVDVPLAQQAPVFQTRNVLTADATGVVSPTIMDHDYAVEYTQTWTGGVQFQPAASMMIAIGYMGSSTLGADNATVRNVPEPGEGAIQARRPIPALGPIRSIRFDGKSIYHGLTLKAEQRPRRGLSYTVSYTLSRSIDDASSPGATESETNLPQNVRNIFSDDGEWARSSFDHRHAIAASAGCELPRGFRVNVFFSAQSGAPFTVNLGVDQANVGAGPAQRPNQTGNPNAPDIRTPERWFDTSVFTLPAPFTFGNAPRNSVIGPGFASLDFALAKTWTIFASRRIELRWEVFNALNEANYDLPNRIFGTPNFGRIFSAKTPREMQIGTRFSF